MTACDALLIVSFGGPERADEVLPFLENVLRGRQVPRARMLEVAEHYDQFGGVSPINAQCRELMAALAREFSQHGPHLPVYWGNRNWHPLLADTLTAMRSDGIRKALAFVTSAYSSYSGCRQYLEDIERARRAVGDGVPEVDKLRPYFNHPGFIEANVAQAQAALARVPSERHGTTQLLFTAHSIPLAMANQCDYEQQLQEVSRLVADRLSPLSWRLVYQSRSGPPSQPWLAPDINDCLHELHDRGTTTDVVVIPIGFTSDHMEVLYDLDTEAQQRCQQLGLNMVRSRTAGGHPRFLQMIRELVLERVASAPRQSIGALGPRPDTCPASCCPAGRPAEA